MQLHVQTEQRSYPNLLWIGRRIELTWVASNNGTNLPGKLIRINFAQLYLRNG